ncbi:acyl-CoA dehydrogenase family protein [Nocardia niigatensis]
MHTDPADDRIDAVLSTLTAESVATYERAGEHPGELFRGLLGTGLADLVVSPDPHPGDRWRFCDRIARICRHWVGLGESIHYQVLATCGLAAGGTPAQRERYLDAMKAGTVIAANCFNEERAGSDLAAMTTTAHRVPEGFVLTGTKQWIGHAQIADILFVYARTGKGGLGGITCFLVETGNPGVTITPRPKTAGASSLPSGDIDFDSVVLSPDSVVGRINRGMVAGSQLFGQGRLGVAACALGLARAALERALEYGNAHEQFGRPIADFQGIAFPIAEASTEIAAARALLREACDAVQHRDRAAELLAAQAKLKAAAAARQATDLAIRTLASRTFDEREAVLRWSAEAHLLEIVQGTPEIQKLAIMSHLG